LPFTFNILSQEFGDSRNFHQVLKFQPVKLANRITNSCLNYSFMLHHFRQIWQNGPLRSQRLAYRRLLAAILFYTCVPLPRSWPTEFDGMARYAPIVGLIMATALGYLWLGLIGLGLGTGLVAAIVVGLWLGITGGLHLDGAMDAADGLGVRDPVRRLAVMSDSRSGAFGVMVAIVILSWKAAALASLPHSQFWVLLAACSFGRWAQLVTIVRDPYLKPNGKGAFHKQALTKIRQILPQFVLLIGLNLGAVLLGQVTPALGIGLAIGGAGIGIAVGRWFNWRFGGQTGDTYGAIVEWTEVLILISANVLVRLG
jgi:adenosylcobinamide-GDP ribazoletransferase